jgi:hypothetical protein
MRSTPSAIAWLAAPVMVFAALTVAPREARAESGAFGLGIVIGSPTGISAKYYLNDRNSIDAAIGGAFVGSHGLSFHADYLWLPAVLARESAFDLGLYVGVGARILEHNRKDNRDDDLHVGVRGPVGLVFDFGSGGVPIDVFAEVALVVDLLIAGDDEDDDHDIIDLNAGIGVRYYF